MRVRGRSNRTPLLIGLAALLLAANAWWFWPRGDTPGQPAFQLAEIGADASAAKAAAAVRLPPQATTEDVRKALLAFARQRICIVALPDASSRMRVHRIVAVRDDSGESENCRSAAG